MKLEAEPAERVGQAGLFLAFSVRRCDGSAAPPVNHRHVDVVDAETKRSFRDSSEWDAISQVGLADDVEFFSVLVLDFSDSIFAGAAADKVVEAAELYIERLLQSDTGSQHRFALVSLGRTEVVRLVQDFTQKEELLSNVLRNMAQARLGSTDLYEAYKLGLGKALTVKPSARHFGRAVVLLSDGRHEAGDRDRQRDSALELLEESRGVVEVYSVGIFEGDYDSSAAMELASSPAHFYDTDYASISNRFEAIASDVAARARGNYVLGVCTPVTRGEPALTLSVKLSEELRAEQEIRYAVDGLTGNVTQCRPCVVSKAHSPDKDCWEECDTEADGALPQGDSISADAQCGGSSASTSTCDAVIGEAHHATLDDCRGSSGSPCEGSALVRGTAQSSPTTGATVVEIQGDTSVMSDSSTPDCASSSAPDAVYRLILQEMATVTVEVDTGFVTVLYRLQTDSRGACGPEIADCRDESGAADGETLTVELPAGTHYFVVDGYEGASGDYTLRSTIRPR